MHKYLFVSDLILQIKNLKQCLWAHKDSKKNLKFFNLPVYNDIL